MIDVRPVFFVIGILLAVLAAVMILPAAADAAVGNRDWTVFAVSAGITLFFGVALIIGNRTPRLRIEVREAFLLATLAFIVAAAAAALPMVLCGLHLNYTDAYFEAMAGLTTTASTVISGLDSAPPGILLWRALLQMLGGIGFMAMAVVVLPFLKVGGMQLFRMDSARESDRALPRTAQVATGIAAIYLVFIAIDATLLWAAGMTGFQAVVHALATVSTGGFSSSDESIGHFKSLPIEIVTTVFMLLGALPFALYLQLMRGRPGRLLRDSQVRAFFGLYAATVLVLTLWQWISGGETFWGALRAVSFTIAAVMTTTGFVTADYDTWGGFAAAVILFLMAVGACTGSPAGGIKIFRLEVLYAATRAQIRRLIQPHGVFVPEYGGRPIPDSVASSVMGFFFLFALTFAVLSLALGATGLDFLTSVSGVASAMSNVGPGLGPVIGPGGNYAALPDAAKWLLSLGMLLGRLELYTALVLLWPGFWRG